MMVWLVIWNISSFGKASFLCLTQCFSNPKHVRFHDCTLVTACSISSRLIRITSMSTYLLIGFLIACPCSVSQLFMSVVHFTGNSISWPMSRVFNVFPSFLAIERCSWEGCTDGRKREENDMSSSLLLEFLVLQLMLSVWGWVSEEFKGKDVQMIAWQATLSLFWGPGPSACVTVELHAGTQNIQEQQAVLA